GRIIDQLVRNNVNPGFTPPSFFGRPLIEGIDGVRITVAVDGDQGRVHEVPRGGASGPDEGLGRPPRRQ
ncbi:MAG: hypothetical protein ACK5XT_15960, partial [Gemmatimonas sp.]